MIVSKSQSGNPEFIKLTPTDVGLTPESGFRGVTLARLNGSDSSVLGHPRSPVTLSYEKLEDWFGALQEAQVMTEDELRAQVENGMFQDSQ